MSRVRTVFTGLACSLTQLILNISLSGEAQATYWTLRVESFEKRYIATALCPCFRAVHQVTSWLGSVFFAAIIVIVSGNFEFCSRGQQRLSVFLLEYKNARSNLTVI